MDHNIYFPTRKELGVYATRRYPKGSGAGGGGDLIPVPTGGIGAELNPTPIVLGYTTAQLAPHAEVERFRYQVPPRRRLKVQTALVRMINGGIGGNNERSSYVAVIRAANSLVQMFAVAITGGGAAFLATQDNNNGEQEFFEGDVIVGRTFDLSGTGTVRYDASVIAVEYDAFFRAQRTVSSGQFEVSTGGVVSQPTSGQTIQPGYWGTGGLNSGLPI